MVFSLNASSSRTTHGLTHGGHWSGTVKLGAISDGISGAYEKTDLSLVNLSAFSA